MSKPRALVIRTAGTNCDAEMALGFELAGAASELIHVDSLIREPQRLDEFDLVGFPGGFSYGDDIASGRIMAMKLRERLYPQLRAAVLRGCPMIGICNGFQALVQVGLLPGPRAGQPWPEDAAPPQRVALSDNAAARYMDRWVGIDIEPRTVCVWTRLLGDLHKSHAEWRTETLRLPVGHGEGRFVAADEQELRELESNGQIALRYAENFNGSQGAVAGVCDATGRVFGLMPHPDRYLFWNRHPSWTRLPAEALSGDAPGLLFFRSAVEAVLPARI